MTRIFYGKINIWHICTVIILLEGTSSSETKGNANETRENHATDVDWYHYTSLMYHAVTISQWNTTWKKTGVRWNLKAFPLVLINKINQKLDSLSHHIYNGVVIWYIYLNERYRRRTYIPIPLIFLKERIYTYCVANKLVSCQPFHYLGGPILQYTHPVNSTHLYTTNVNSTANNEIPVFYSRLAEYIHIQIKYISGSFLYFSYNIKCSLIACT